MARFLKRWAARQLERATFWPGVAFIVSVVWLFRSKQGVEEFNAWVMASGVFLGILTAGVVTNKRLNRRPPSEPEDPSMNVSQEMPAFREPPKP